MFIATAEACNTNRRWEFILLHFEQITLHNGEQSNFIALNCRCIQRQARHMVGTSAAYGGHKGGHGGHKRGIWWAQGRPWWAQARHMVGTREAYGGHKGGSGRYYLILFIWLLLYLLNPLTPRRTQVSPFT